MNRAKNTDIWRLVSKNRPAHTSFLSLRHLPVQILIKILSFLNQHTLTRILLTCKHLNNIGTPVLYKNVTLEPSQGTSFVRALGGNERFHPFIQGLTVHDHHTVDTRYAQIMATTILHLRNLRFLRIKGCYTRFQWVDEVNAAVQDTLYVETFRAPFLSRLETLEINLSQTDPWLMAERECIFNHPNLRTLSIINASMSDFHAFKPAMHHTSPLNLLRFLCCDISPRTLAKVLSVPRALTCFVIMGPRQDGEPQYIDANAALYVEALKPQAHSLVQIQLGFWVFDKRRVSTLDFSGFHNLIDLLITPYVTQDERTGKYTDLLPLVSRWSPFPASLRHLSIFHLNPQTLSATETILMATLSRLVHQGAIPNLRGVTLSTPQFGDLLNPAGPNNRSDFRDEYVLPVGWERLMLGRIGVHRVRVLLTRAFPLSCPCCDFYMGKVVFKS